MAQMVRGVFDLGGARAVADPRQDEARAREASARAERDLRSQIAARLANQQQGQQALAQAESQFSRGQQFAREQAGGQRAWEEVMRREGFAHDTSENALNRQAQAGQFGESMRFQRERAGAEDAYRGRAMDQSERQFMEQLGLQKYAQFSNERNADRGFTEGQRQFNESQRNDVLRFLAGLYENRNLRGQEQTEAANQRARALVAEYSDQLSEHEGLSDEAIRNLRFQSTLDPGASGELSRIINAALNPSDVQAHYADQTDAYSLMTDPANSEFLTRLGLVSTPEQNRRQANRTREAFPAQTAQRPADLVLEALLSRIASGQ